jgi:hypothetical protein
VGEGQNQRWRGSPPIDGEDMKSGYTVGKAAAIAEWQFRKEVRDFVPVVNRLRVAKWQRENPERRRANANRYAAKPSVRARMLELARKRTLERHRAEGKVFTCELEHCRAQFCRVPGVRGMGMHPRFCSAGHYQTWHSRQKRKASGGNLKTCTACGEKGHSRRGCAGAV